MKFFLATLCIVLGAIAFTNAQAFGRGGQTPRGQTPTHGQVDRQSKISSE